MLHNVVFLDRDGVINHDSPEYIKSCAEFEFLAGSLEAIRDLTVNGFNIIIITNQSVIGRKMVSESGLKAIFDLLTSKVEASGGKIKDIFFCPHVPEDQCRCRKPETGLIQAAQQKYGIDLSKTYMVGDSTKDIECAKKAGCGRSILVKTGNGPAAEQDLIRKNLIPDHVAADLFEAAQWILEDFKQSNPAL